MPGLEGDGWGRDGMLTAAVLLCCTQVRDRGRIGEREGESQSESKSRRD